jgi:hypothetical protein
MGSMRDLAGNKRYTMFKQAIGSKQTKLGFHGMIALTVFARCATPPSPMGPP